MTADAFTETQLRILGAARGLLEHRSVGELRMRDIARAGGLAPASMYDHFRGKDGLLQALWQLEATDLADRFERALETAAEGVGGMVAFGYTIFSDFAGYARSRARTVEFLLDSRFGATAKDALVRGHHQLRALLVNALQRTFPGIPLRRAKALSDLTLAITSGLALAHLYGGNELDPDELFGQWLELLELSAAYLKD
ncbi:MAG: helix-turn-helix domain containing protein [bacterium]|nr:helix-turn-helix domain containing protein [bacterium]